MIKIKLISLKNSLQDELCFGSPWKFLSDVCV